MLFVMDLNQNQIKILSVRVRKIINNSNLNISKKIYFESNIGVRNIFKIGLDWVFRFEKQIIILEDDILASKSFFPFVINYS